MSNRPLSFQEMCMEHSTHHAVTETIMLRTGIVPKHDGCDKVFFRIPDGTLLVFETSPYPGNLGTEADLRLGLREFATDERLYWAQGLDECWKLVAAVLDENNITVADIQTELRKGN